MAMAKGLTLTALSIVAVGVGWLGQPVTVPLGALLALTFVPTMELITAFKSYIPERKEGGR